MTLDGQVLLIAFLATSLELILWATESDNRFPRQRSTSPGSNRLAAKQRSRTLL